MRRGRPGLDGASSKYGTGESISAPKPIRRRTPRCAEIRPLLDTFHDGALDLDRAQRVAEHVAGCDHCAARLAEIASVDRLVASRPGPTAPVALRAGLYARIAATASQPALAPTETAPRPAERHATVTTRPVARGAHRRRVSVISGAASLIALAAVVAVVLLSAPRPHPVAGRRHPVVTTRIASANSEPGASVSRSVSSLSALPRFADWRAAYVGFDQRFHVVTADGALDIAAPLPSALGASWARTVLRGLSVSPDGHMVASILRASSDASGPVALLSLAGGALTTVHVSARELFWSPASDRLAVNVGDERQPHLAVIHPDDGSVTDLPGHVSGAPVTLFEVLGWTDAGHLAVIYSPPAVMVNSPVRAATPTASSVLGTYALGALDADSGDVRQVAALPSDARGVYLTPNGAEALVTPSPAGPAEVILTASGAVRSLPAITRTLEPMTSQTLAVYSDQAQTFATTGVWQPTSDDLAVSLAATSGGAPTLWLLDADHDAATPLGSHRTPLAWTPDGRTLLLAGSPVAGASAISSDDPQPALYALTPVGPGGVERLLTGKMAQFVGLVRTV